MFYIYMLGYLEISRCPRP